MGPPRHSGNKRRNDAMPETVTVGKKRCIRNENDSNECERSDSQENDGTQSPSCQDQQIEVRRSSRLRYQRNVVRQSAKVRYQQCDFSQLPQRVWTMIMSSLQQRDRLALAVTCRKLHMICKTESVLWRSAALYLGSWKCDCRPRQVELNATEMTVLKSHSHQIQEMKIMIVGMKDLVFSRKSFNILNEYVTSLPLKKMKIHCRSVPYSVDMYKTNRLIRECLTSEKVKGLEELSFPEFLSENGGIGLAVLQALKVSPFTDSLQTLRLGGIRTDEKTRFGPGTNREVLECIGRFKNLQTLWLVPQFVSDRLLETLLNCMTTQLKELGFSGCFADRTQDNVTKWPQLVSSMPDLRICLEVLCVMEREDVSDLFPSLVPVKSVQIGDFDHDNHEKKRLLKLLPAYSTLTELVWHELSDSNFDSVLIDAVKKCPKLDTLRIYGGIRSSSIITLASMRDWKELEFLEKRVIFPKSKMKGRCARTSWQGRKLRRTRMSRLKAKVLSLVGGKCVFIPCVGAIGSKDLKEIVPPFGFKFKCQPFIH